MITLFSLLIANSLLAQSNLDVSYLSSGGKLKPLQAIMDIRHYDINLDVNIEQRTIKGNTIVTGRQSPNSLYSMKHVTFEDDQGAYDQFDAQGFIKLNALRLRLGAMAGRKGGAL